MPVLDGYEAAKQIREREQHAASFTARPVCIVALTASVLEEERDNVLEAGCDDFIRKPFHENEIFEALRKHLGVRFVYEEEAQEIETRDQSVEYELTWEALTALPAEWLTEMKVGAEMADIATLSAIVGRIQARDAELASALKRLVDNFEYEVILALL